MAKPQKNRQRDSEADSVTETESSAEKSFAELYPKLGEALDYFHLEIKALPRSYPRLVATIDSTWGSDECFAFLNSLFLSDRPDRQGFPSEVIDEITLVKNIFEVSFPKIAINPHDPFSSMRAADIENRIKELAALGKAKKEHQGALRNVEAPISRGTGKLAARADEINSCAKLVETLDNADQVVASRDSRKLLGEHLVEMGVADAPAIAKALEYQERSPVRHLIGEILVMNGSAGQADVYRALSLQRRVPIVDCSSMEISPDAVRLVPIRIARLKGAMPITLHQRRLVVAVPNPFDPELQEYFSFLSGTKAILVFATPERIAAAQASYGHVSLGDAGDRADRRSTEKTEPATAESHASSLIRNVESGSVADEVIDELDDSVLVADSFGNVDENDETVIGLVNKVINDAVRVGASDIHFEAFPRSRNAQIRFRKDGVMEAHSEYSISYHPAVVSRIKIMSDLDISEKRKAQDGKIAFGHNNKKMDLRVSTIPTSNGLEVVTVRLLNSGKPMALSKIGMHPDTLAVFREQIIKPYGLILVCGPTGSGKTTTLHSVLRELNTPERKIWTAEDPVEVVQRNVSQVQVLPKIGWTFAQALRSFLRADPDVIMIGEIRDSETAKVAVEASMTGHLVMSTLHTNSACETLARLMDLEVQPFNLADAALAVLAQRLARRVCRDCGEAYEFSDEELDTLVTEYFLAGSGKSGTKAERDRLLARWRNEFSREGGLRGIRASGCGACNGSGYHGRLGIHELLAISPDIRKLVRASASTGEIFKQAILDGMKTLRQDGIEKVVQGLTDLKEVRTVCL